MQNRVAELEAARDTTALDLPKSHADDGCRLQPFAATSTRTGEVILVLKNTSFALQPSPALAQAPNSVGLIRFSRANPSGSSGQDKTRIGENRASAVCILGPHQVYR
jgi:hypothetical protein